MKRFRLIVLSIFLTGISTGLFSAQINKTDAWRIARDFMVQKSGSTLRSASDVRLVYACIDSSSLLRSTDTTTYYYVFNIGEQQGFVIISGEDATKTILGYSREGAFCAEKMPANLKYWMDGYQAEIKLAIENGWSTIPLEAPSNASLRAASEVAPLLGSIRWNQNNPYNYLCPFDVSTNQYTVTGCVATAMAQIMKFYEWPVTGTGSNSYSPSAYSTQSANFSKTNYDWNNMLDSYGSNSTSIEDSAVATLMFHCGVAVNMDYHTSADGGSSAQMIKAGNALYSNFGYDSDIQIYNRIYETASDWKTKIKSELDASRPILYAGSSDASGHAFICDGYDLNDLFHINWGWGGMSNGYFELSALDPSSQGIGGSTSGYSRDQQILIGIKKPDGLNQSINQLGIYSEGLTPSISSGTTSGKFNITFGFRNYGINSFSGSVGVGLYQNGVFKKTLKTSAISNLASTYAYPSYAFNSTAYLSGLTSGTYQLYAIYQKSGTSTWSILKGTTNLNNSLEVVVNGTNATIKAPSSNPVLTVTQPIQLSGNAYLNKTGLFNLTVQNTGAEFYSNLGILLFSTSDSNISQFVDYGVVCIPAGATKTFAVSGIFTCAPGTYYAVAVYDSTNSYSAINFKALNQPGYSPIPITILNEPAAPILSLTNQIVLTNGSTAYLNENISLTAAIKNTGGFSDSKIMAFVFPSAGGNSLGYLNPETPFIENNETKIVTFNGSMSLAPGNYFFGLFYYLNGWSQFSPSYYSTYTFTLAERSTNLNETKKSLFEVYPNPVKDNLHIQTSETINKMEVFDYLGRKIRIKPEAGIISVSHLEKGAYLLRMETDNGVQSRSFLKE